MKLFILRHGMTAESTADELRELSETGVQEVRNIVSQKLDELSRVRKIYSSPLLRVRQTLSIAAELMQFRGQIEESQDLKTGSRLDEIKHFAAELDTDNGDVLVSSHQSCTSILVLWLTGEDVLISNGSLLAIEVSEFVQGGGKILWQESHNSNQIKRATNFVDQF